MIFNPDHLELKKESFLENIQLPKRLLHQLQDILEDVRAIDGCENPDIIGSFFIEGRDEITMNIAVRSTIYLYRDGGDWAEEDENGHFEGIGVLFCRIDKDWDGNVTQYIHIPDDAAQDMLLACQSYRHQLLLGDAADLGKIMSHLKGALQAPWKTLEDCYTRLALEERYDDLEDEGEE